ncbi:phosphatase PAP2 family protein [Ferruginibacter albus]|uniref:phosphatase PAP2 family protein n=1 Tax=Ferruginibacter albus TaxID=2875540 RepID=UPI001CC4F22D|nr:phosphatase PAP2 family protein [Ferruginibacter albus]UAY51868.1 phosphatase PAP2 family protein [Ferruginibacter albus]
MKKTIADNCIFFTGYIVFVLCVVVFITAYNKVDGFLLLNNFHCKPLTAFLNIYTNAGDGVFSLALVLLFFLFKNRSIAIQILLSFLLSGAIVQIIKHSYTMLRPKALLLQEHISYSLIDTIQLAGNNSFPSGHATSAFALATILAINIKNKWWGLLFLLFAISIAYSRVYVGDHFPVDTLGGSMVGVLTALLIHQLTLNRFYIKRQNLQ